MDFELSTEQRQFQASIDAWLGDRYDFAQRRTTAASALGYSNDHWQQFAAMGWLGLPLPESFGGLGGSAVDTHVLLERFGAHLVVEPYLATVLLGAKLIERAGSPTQQAGWLPAVATGQRLLAFAHGEANARFELAHVETRAKAAGTNFVIDGSKSLVLHAASADAIVVSARTAGAVGDPHGVSLFLVERGAAGLARRDYTTLDGQRASDLRLEHVEVGATALLGPLDQAHQWIEEVSDRAMCALCAEAVGAMRAAIELTREHLCTRRQFGAPIGSNQVLRHRFVDMHIAQEESKSMTDMAAMRIDAGSAGRRALCAATKAKVGRAARFVGEQTIQLHGGIGMTDEYPAGHYYKRLAAIDTLFGNTDYHLGSYAGSTFDLEERQ